MPRCVDNTFSHNELAAAPKNNGGENPLRIRQHHCRNLCCASHKSIHARSTRANTTLLLLVHKRRVGVLRQDWRASFVVCHGGPPSLRRRQRQGAPFRPFSFQRCDPFHSDTPNRDRRFLDRLQDARISGQTSIGDRSRELPAKGRRLSSELSQDNMSTRGTPGEFEATPHAKKCPNIQVIQSWLKPYQPVSRTILRIATY